MHNKTESEHAYNQQFHPSLNFITWSNLIFLSFLLRIGPLMKDKVAKMYFNITFFTYNLFLA